MHFSTILQKIKIIFFILIITAIFQSAAIGKTLRIASNTQYTSFDPMVAYDWLSYQTLTHVCSHLTILVSKDGDINYQLEIASNLEYKNDNKTLVFTILKNQTFHDGRALNAYDIEFSLNRVTNPKLESPGATFFKDVKGFDQYQKGQVNHLTGVKALDEYTLQIELVKKSHSFLYVLTTNFGCIIPKGTSLKTIEKPISSGPFQFDKFENNNLFLKRYQKYNKRNIIPSYSMIKIATALATDDVLAGFANDQFDIILDGLPWASVSALTWGDIENEKDLIKKWEKKSNTGLSTTYLTMNTKIAPFNNVLVRQAVNYAINRDKLITILSGAATKTTHIPSPGFKEFHLLEEQYFYSPEKAKELLSKARKLLKKDFFEADLYAIDTDLYRKVVSSIISDLQKVGIYISPHFSSHKAVLDVAGSETPGQMIFSDGLGWIADYPEVSNFYFPLLSKDSIQKNGWNWSHYFNPSVEAMAEEADSLIGEENDEKRSQLWTKIFAQIEQEAPWAALYNRRVPNVYSKSLLADYEVNKKTDFVGFFYILTSQGDK